MHKGMLVTQHVARTPPVCNVRMDSVRLRDQNIAETLTVFRIVVVEELQPVHVLEIKIQRASAAVDFNRDMVLASEGGAGGLEIGQRPVVETPDERRGVIHRHLAPLLDRFGRRARNLAGLARQRTFLDERVHQAADFLEFTHEVARQINDVNVDVAVRPAAADAVLQPPLQRELRVRQPVLRITGVVVVNLAERAFADHFLRQRNRRDTPVIVANHMDDARLVHGGQHLLGLLGGQRERLFAEDVFAGPGGRDGNFRVRIVWRVDVHHINER